MRTKAIALIVLGAVAIATITSVASGDDHTDLAGPEKALLLIEEEIADHESNGMSENHPVMAKLLEKRQRYQDLAAGPPPEEPDPDEVAEILSRQSDTKGGYEVGLLEQCEGGLGTPDIPDELILRCVSIPQSNDTGITAWILSDGRAWIHNFKSQASGQSSDSAWVDIPTWPNLDEAEFEVDGETLNVVFPDETLSFDTSEWRQAAESAD